MKYWNQQEPILEHYTGFRIFIFLYVIFDKINEQQGLMVLLLCLKISSHVPFLHLLHLLQHYKRHGIN